MKNSLTLISLLWLSFGLTEAVAQTSPDIKEGEAWEQKVNDSLGATFGDLTRREIGKRGALGDDDKPETTEGAQGTDGRGTGSGDGTGTIGIGAGGGPLDPASLDADKPDIAALIRQWLSMAQPPINAKGAKAHYTEWGSLEGQLIGGQTLNVGRPDAAGGMTPPVYVWSIRQRLDSIDHCKLEEYVIAQLARDNIAKCRGRYQQVEMITVANMVGRPGAEAKKTLEAKGLKVSLSMGKAATSKAQSYKVVRQDHEGGTQVVPATIIKLTLYDEYKAPVTVPALVGLSGTVARSRLLATGLTVKANSIGAAPDAKQAFRVRDTVPPANSQVAKGSLVVINTYTAFDDNVVMPNILGMSRREAQQKLDSLGINSRTKESGEPPRQQQQYIVTAQSPAKGVKIRPSTRAEFTHYGAYIWRMIMPDLRGLSRDMVSASFSDGKIIITSVWGDAAPTNAKSETVATQSITPGTQIREGASLRLVYYRKSRDHQLAAFTCKIPNSTRYWNAAKSVPGCQCRQGFSPSRDGKKCVKNKTREQLVAEFRCTVPNSQSYWNQSTGSPACQCRQGFSPSRDGKNCQAPRPAVPTVRTQPQIKPQVIIPQTQTLPHPPPHIASQGLSCEKLRKMGYRCPVRNCMFGVIGDDCDL